MKVHVQRQEENQKVLEKSGELASLVKDRYIQCMSIYVVIFLQSTHVARVFWIMSNIYDETFDYL